MGAIDLLMSWLWWHQDFIDHEIDPALVSEKFVNEIEVLAAPETDD